MKKFRILYRYFSGYIQASCNSCHYQFAIHKDKKNERQIECPACREFEEKDWALKSDLKTKDDTIIFLDDNFKKQKTRGENERKNNF